jgi:O-antigen/teichoic acid export membrane protein
VRPSALFFKNVTEEQTIVKNVFWLFTGQLFNRLFNFIAVAFAARILGVNAFGALSFAFAFVLISFTFSDFGVNQLVMREYKRTPADKRKVLLSHFWFLKLALIAASAVLAGAIYIGSGIAIAPAAFLLVAIIVITDCIRDFYTSIARATERANLEGMVLIVDGVLTAVFGVGALIYFQTLTGLLVGYAIAGACALILSVILIVKENIQFNLILDVPETKRLLKQLWPFAIGAVCAAALLQIDMLLLGWLQGAEAVAYYAPGARIVQILLIVPTLVGAALLPALSQPEKAAEAKVLLKKALSFITMLALPITAGGAVTAPALLTALYGEKFTPGSTAFGILLVLFLLYAWTSILNHVLLSRNLQNKSFLYSSIALVVNVALGITLIPYWGIVGAAAGALTGQGAALFLTTRAVRKLTGEPLVASGEITCYAVAAAITVLCVTPVREHALLSIALGSCVYLAVLTALKTPLLREGWKLVKS